MATKQLYDLGDMPPLGEVPEKMHAFLVRQDRFGDPIKAWQREVIDTPKIGPKDVLVYVMATGVNYNNVWAALGFPVDVIKDRQKKGEPEDFHAGGSDASGIVWAVGEEVSDVKIGDEVVVHSGWWEPDDPWVLSGRDQCLRLVFVFGVIKRTMVPIVNLLRLNPIKLRRSLNILLGKKLAVICFVHQQHIAN